MKVIEARVALVMAAALCGFFFHAGERHLMAVPFKCPRYDCKTVYGWWVNQSPGGTQCFAAKVTGTANNTTNAVAPIYALGSTETLPVVVVGTYDRWIFPANMAQCPMVNGAWPSPQEVWPGGTGALSANTTRIVCTYNP